MLCISRWCSCSTYVRKVEKAVRREPVHYSIIYLSALYKMYSQMSSQKRHIWLRTCFDTDDLVTQANLATYNEAEHWYAWLERKALESSETPSWFWQVRNLLKQNPVFINCILLIFEENFLHDLCLLQLQMHRKTMWEAKSSREGVSILFSNCDMLQARIVSWL